jgi:uncharacterized membrane protein YhhN
MLASSVIASIMAGAVISLLHAVRVGDRTKEVMSKTVASAAFVILGVVRWSAGDPIDTWLIAALVLCAAGDFCLLFDRTFDLGLISFLLGHLAYVAGFAVALPCRDWSLLILIPMVAAGAIAARWLWPHLGRRRISVTAYIIAISIMVWGGVSAFSKGALPWTAAAGAVLFYLSDLAVARQRFVHEDFINRALGLPIYYVGQLLLALTIGAS